MLRYLALCALAATLPAGAGAQTVRLTAVRAETVRINPNLLPNPGFEEVGPDGVPAGWQWTRNNTDATLAVVEDGARSGRRAIMITNGTPFGAHVYAMLWRSGPVRLEAGRAYTLSAWVRSEQPGNIGLMGGGGWQWRAYAPPTGREWRRFWVTFTPDAGERDFTARITTESHTKGAWLDDLKLEEGDTPTPVEPPGGESAPAQLMVAAPETEIQGDGPFGASFLLFAPRPFDGTVEAALAGAKPVRQQLRLEPGAWRLVVTGESRAIADAPRMLTLRLVAGDAPLQSKATLRFYSASNALGRLVALRKTLPAMKRALDRRKTRREDVSYPLASYTVLASFIPYAEEDARRGEVKRALTQAADLEAMAARLRRDLQAAKLPAVPRWTGAKRPAVHRSSFLAPVRWPDGRAEERPVFFTGYGHFGQVRADIEKFPAYGTNIVQVEFGPNSVFPADGPANPAPMREMRALLDRAQKAGVAVNLLISPHYLPAWAFEKWPHLRKRREGFLPYCLHAPEAQDLLNLFLAEAINPLKGHPALHSICLSNEPVNVEEPCEYAARLWHEWLKTRHGDAATMNARWGTDYASFDAVPLPDPFGPRPPGPVWMDYVRFNQEFFADWHAKLAAAVHAVDPDLPVHAKAMTWTLLNDGDVRYGADATLFGGFSQVNGNDSINWYGFGGGEFAQGWQMNAMGHDLQRSALDAPVFNSENHLITDRDTRPVPAAHVYATLWLAAVHGQSATTIWVWERTFDPKSDFAGSIMHRPACAEAVGRVNLDLNRAAREVTALQQAKPQVLLLTATSAAVWDMGRQDDARGKLYTALAFTGLKTGFVTERQLEQGVVPNAPVLFVPGIVHLSDAAFAALQKYRGRIVYVGEGNLLSRDEYDRPRTAALPGETLPYRYGPTTWRDLWKPLWAKLPGWGLHPPADLVGADGQPAWGIVWRCAETPEGAIVNLCNQRNEPVPLVLRRGGQPVRAVDRRTGQWMTGAFTLQPLEIRLLRLERDR